MTEENNQVLQQVTQTPSYLEWVRVEELGYEQPTLSSTMTTTQEPEPERICFTCAKPLTKPYSTCGKCKVAGYCTRTCQIQDWKTVHKAACHTYARVVGSSLRNPRFSSAAAAAQARQEIFHRIRFYACAYAVYKESTLGRGFLFLQGDQSLVTLSLAIPKDVYGHPIQQTRGIMVHYLTLGEYDAELCRDDFELATVRNELTHAVNTYDPQTEVVLLMRFRCGHVAVGKAQFAMPHGSFRTLGTQFFAEQDAACLQLNIDDV
jgi:hypothetical protein